MVDLEHNPTVAYRKHNFLTLLLITQNAA
uniref:Uncharacterized protein n=1 Tax=Anguilla anguilla TaxID=7936 RepID=A0A0E9QRQ2_ANGAN